MALDPTVVFKSIADEHDADIYLFCADVSNLTTDEFITLVRKHKSKRPNCVLLLTTFGGDPDAGYRIVRAIKKYYKKFILLVYGTCKSTGTLIALGADEIAMGDFGEFGPLDIQLAKDDEMLHTSGLSYIQSMTSLTEQIFQSFETNFLRLKQRSGGSITTRTAAEVASKLAVGLISPISAQLDPIKLGEVYRAIRIADAYGARLNQNYDITSRLITEYPSHSFVIDYEEAEEIFDSVRPLNDNELLLEKMLLKQVRNEGMTPMIVDLSKAYIRAPEPPDLEPSTASEGSAEQEPASEPSVEKPPEDAINDSSPTLPQDSPNNETATEQQPGQENESIQSQEDLGDSSETRTRVDE